MSTTTQPVVSFLLVLNPDHPEYFQTCVESILAQTFIDAEVLILNPTLSDEQPEIPDSLVPHNPRIKPIPLKDPLHPLDYYNYTIQQAQGTLIWILPVDHCLASPQIVQSMVTQFILNPNLGVAFCRAQHMDELGNPYESYSPHKKNTDLPYQPTIYPGLAFFRHLLKGNVIPDACAVARKECYIETGLFEPTLAGSAAWYNWLRFSLEWDVFFDPAPKVFVRKAKSLLSKRSSLSQDELEDRYNCYQALESHLKENGYPKLLRQQTHFAKLQFMRRKGFTMSFPQKMMRLYHTLTAPRFDLTPV